MNVSAKLRYLRQSPRKVRLVVDLVRGMDVAEAEGALLLLNKKATEPLVKLLRSAIANAENNFKLDRSKLFVKEIRADDGPTLKRYRPRAYGRAAMLRKRTTHVSIILAEREVKTADSSKKTVPVKKKSAAKAVAKKPVTKKVK